MAKYAIDWRVEGTWIVEAASPDEAQDKFDRAWEGGRIKPERDGEASNSDPQRVDAPRVRSQEPRP